MLASLALCLLDDRGRFGLGKPMDRDGGRIELDPDAPDTDAIYLDEADRRNAGGAIPKNEHLSPSLVAQVHKLVAGAAQETSQIEIARFKRIVCPLWFLLDCLFS